jgi:hypothetical protein
MLPVVVLVAIPFLTVAMTVLCTLIVGAVVCEFTGPRSLSLRMVLISAHAPLATLNCQRLPLLQHFSSS